MLKNRKMTWILIGAMIHRGLTVFPLLVLASSFAWSQPLLIETEKILASDGAMDDHFGQFVSVNGNVAVATSHLHDHDSPDSGSTYVYRFNGATWLQEQELLAGDGAADDNFGESVSVSGDVIGAGAFAHDHNGIINSGAAYVYRFDGTTWVEEQELLASDGAIGDNFGIFVSVSGNVAIVGAQRDDDNGANSGSAYMYRFDDISWVEEQKLLGSDGASGDEFGWSVSVSGNVAMVGAYLHDHQGNDSGSAYVYRFDGSTWVEEQELLAGDGAADDGFGWGVSVSGNVAIVGARHDDDNGANSGSAYMYRFDGTSWVEEQKLLGSDGAAGDGFGWSVSVNGDVAMVGALFDDDNGTDSGSAYAYRFDGAMWVEEKLSASDGAANDLFGSSVSVSGNRAVVGAFGDDDNGIASGSAYIFTPTADLQITKTDGVTSAVPGQSLIYSIIASNNGPSNVSSASVSDTFPADLTCSWTSVAVGGATGNTSGSGNLNETLSMPTSSSVTYTVPCTIDPGATGALSNMATISSATDDPTPGNNSSTDGDTVLMPSADLSITKSDGGASVVPGTNLTYTLAVTNNGPSDSTGGTVSDVLPSGLSFVSSSDGCTEAGGTVSCPFGGLVNGADVSLSFVVAVSASPLTVLTNTATMAANETDPQGANNSDTESTLVLSPSAAIPTLDTWGLLALVVLLAGAGSRLLRRT